MKGLFGVSWFGSAYDLAWFRMVTVQTGRARHMLYGSFPKMRGPQYRPQDAIVLILGTPEKVPVILGNPKPETLYTPYVTPV